MEQKQQVFTNFRQLRWICGFCTSFNRLDKERCLVCDSWRQYRVELRIGELPVKVVSASDPTKREGSEQTTVGQIRLLDEWLALFDCKEQQSHKTVNTNTNTDTNEATLTIDPTEPWHQPRDQENDEKRETTTTTKAKATTMAIMATDSTVSSISLPWPVWQSRTATIGLTRRQMWGRLNSTHHKGRYSEWLAQKIQYGWKEGTTKGTTEGATKGTRPKKEQQLKSGEQKTPSTNEQVNERMRHFERPPDLNNLNNERQDGTCPLCCEPTSALTGLACKHLYCLVCWQGWCQTLSDPAQGHCMAPKCKTAMSLPFYLCAMNHQKSRKLTIRQIEAKMEIYRNTVMNSFIQSHDRQFRPCTTEGCLGFWNLKSTASRLACPECFRVYCAKCFRMDHFGLECDLAQSTIKYDGDSQDKTSDEELTELWIRSFCRDCPKCQVPIQKMEGCNHMSCKSCKFQFCWKCGVEWSIHKICEAIQKDSKEEEQMKSRMSLESRQKLRAILGIHLPVLRAIASRRTQLQLQRPRQRSVQTAWKNMILGIMECYEYAFLCLAIRAIFKADNALFQFNVEEMKQWWTKSVCRDLPPKSASFETIQKGLYQMMFVGDGYMRTLIENIQLRPVCSMDQELYRQRSKIQRWTIRFHPSNRTRAIQHSFYYVMGIKSLACISVQRLTIRPEFPNQSQGEPVEWKTCLLPFLHSARYQFDANIDGQDNRVQTYIEKHHTTFVPRQKGYWLVIIQDDDASGVSQYQYQLVVPHRDFILGARQANLWLKTDCQIHDTLIE